MTKDEITKALTTTADTNEPSGLMLDWEGDIKLTVTAPDGLVSFTLSRNGGGSVCFYVKIDDRCVIFGDKLTIVDSAAIMTVIIADDDNMVGKIYME